jgi:hypothetical protein
MKARDLDTLPDPKPESGASSSPTGTDPGLGPQTRAADTDVDASPPMPDEHDAFDDLMAGLRRRKQLVPNSVEPGVRYQAGPRAPGRGVDTQPPEPLVSLNIATDPGLGPRVRASADATEPGARARPQATMTIDAAPARRATLRKSLVAAAAGTVLVAIFVAVLMRPRRDSPPQAASVPSIPLAAPPSMTAPPTTTTSALTTSSPPPPVVMTAPPPSPAVQTAPVKKRAAAPARAASARPTTNSGPSIAADEP